MSELSPDSGEISMPKQTKIAYLSQHLDLDINRTIMDCCLDCFKEFFDTERDIESKRQALESISDENEITKVLNEIADLEIKLEALEQGNPHSEISKILRGFGFKENQFSDPISSLSGGWQMRVQMAQLLLSKPDLLLLDEPDNHLDIEALIWFENYLKSFNKAVLFISHDVEFMTNVANNIFELSNRKLFSFKGNYPKYIAAKALRREKEQQAFTNQQKVIKQKERTITRFMAKESKTKMAQSMKKQLDKMERIEIDQDDVTKINIQFPVTKAPGKVVTTVNEASKSYGDNHVLDKISLEVLRGKKIAFVGQNGQGKSTLVKMIAGLIPYNSGQVELGYNVELNYFAQDQSETLDPKMTVLETIESKCDPDYYTSCRKTLGAFAFSGDDVYKKVSVLSGGEKSRLAMACLVSQKSNFLILDEPTNHLDIHSKTMLKQAIVDYPGTLIIVSHDREILKGSIDETYEFRDRQLIHHLGDLEYVLSKRKADDIRTFQQTEDKKAKVQAAPKKQLSYEEQKQINRKISKAEKMIEQLEKDIADIHQKLVDPNFYNSVEGTAALKSLKTKESELDEWNLKWEEAVGMLP